MKAWRDSASLILAARQGLRLNIPSTGTPFQYDYKLLNLKRHQNASFMPGSHVFPGGTVEQSDADTKWKKLFSGFGFGANSFAPLFTKDASRPPIFKPRRNELPREISLRITAIRETFEECGILMCKRTPKKGILTEWAEHLADEDLKDWQARVHDDSTEFYRMCEGLNCYPDIWALHEWSNWLTPTFFHKRFDTVFYVACMNTQPNALLDNREMEDLTWDDPEGFLSPTNGYKLPPPQHYELSRIAKFESLDNLLDFAIARSKKGMRLILPVKVKLADGDVHVIPGDSMYPDEVSLTDKQILDRRPMTIAEFRDISPAKNRMEYFTLDVAAIAVENTDSIDGHLTPFPVETVQIKPVKS